MKEYATDKMIAEGKRLRKDLGLAIAAISADVHPSLAGELEEAQTAYENFAAGNLEAYRNTIEVLWWAMRWDQMIIAGPETSVEGLANLRTDVESR